MSVDFPTLVQTLASFAPSKASLRGAPWDDSVDWLIANGLGPLAAYNVEYRLTGAGVPAWARDRLWSVYQGLVNDNVMKLVNFKRAIDGLEGRRLGVLGAASFAEALYPHVAFRPVAEIELLLAPADVAPLAGFLRRAQFKPEGTAEGAQLLADGRTALVLRSDLAPGVDGLGPLARAQPLRMYGPSAYRLDLEDALLAQVARLRRLAFAAPLIEWVDLRELATGAAATGGEYSRALRLDVLRARAAELGLERTLWAALTLVGHLFPTAQADAWAARPALDAALGARLDALLVAPRRVLEPTAVAPASAEALAALAP